MIKYTKKNSLNAKSLLYQKTVEMEHIDKKDDIPIPVPAFASINEVKILEMLLSFILMIVFIISSFILYQNSTKKYDIRILDQKLKYIFFTLAFYFCVLIATWFFSDIFSFLIAKITYNPKKYNFTSFVLGKYGVLFKLALTIFLFAHILTEIGELQEPSTSSEEENDSSKAENINEVDIEEEEKAAHEKEVITNTRKILEKTILEVNEILVKAFLLAKTYILMTILLQIFAIQYLRYKIYCSYYSKRITESNRDLEYIHKLNTFRDYSETLAISQKVEMIFNDLKDGDREMLLEEDFIKHFGQTHGHKMFHLFDENGDNLITKKDLLKTYRNIYKNKTKLQISLNQTRLCMKKLQVVLFLASSPVLFFFFLRTTKTNTDAASVITNALAIFLPLSFIFRDISANLFQSIVFVSGVRAFDVGDNIQIGNNRYLVYEIGLLYTTLISDSKFLNCPNSILISEVLANSRKSSYVTETFDFCIFCEKSEAFIKGFKELVENFIDENSSFYRPEFMIYGYKWDRNGALSFKIDVQIDCSYEKLNMVRKRRLVFSRFIYNQFKMLNIKTK